MCISGAQPCIFWGTGGFLEWGHFDKRSMYSTQKKGPQGKILVFFLEDDLKIAF